MDFLPGSFRDPYGGVFSENGNVFRWISPAYEPHYRHLIDSGLYDQLINKGWLIPHHEVENTWTDLPSEYRVVEPETIPFISYPYEWSFLQYREAALLTLSIQLMAMEYGMSLRDASAYNIQFHRGKVTFIDTTSFEILRPGTPWVAYGQFCRHFLAPLALMAGRDIRLGTLMQQYTDGIPLDMVYKLLPFQMKIKPGLAIHLFLHGKAGKKNSSQPSSKAPSFSSASFYGLIHSLENIVKSLKVKSQISTWEDYYKSLIINDLYLISKKDIIAGWIDKIRPSYTWDLGANDGTFGRICAAYGLTIAFDSDPLAVEWGYQQVQNEKVANLLPLRLDITNPSPGLGWVNTERTAWLGRPLPQLTLALALVHHLVIGNNIPLAKLALLFAQISSQLIIEFVPKTDPKVQEMLGFREDIFSEYHEKGFEDVFSRYFLMEEKCIVPHSDRILYLMQRKD
ncbi:MAG: SAM-dependent methyltransferase [Bacteroidia bacterium]